MHNSLGFPGVTTDDQGGVFLSFCAVREDLLGLGVTTAGSEGKVGIAADIYSIGSFDGGITWEAPRNIAEDIDGSIGFSWTEEDQFLYVYPWVINGEIHMTWQSDDYIDRQFDSTIPGIIEATMVSYSFNPILLGLAENVESNVKLGVYPNPANDRLYIDLDLRTDAKYQIAMTNMLGQIVLEYNVDLSAGANKVDLDVKTLSPGIYIVSVQSSQSAVSTKVIIE